MAVVPFDPSIARARRSAPPARAAGPPRLPLRPPQRAASPPAPAPPQPRLRVNLSPAAATRALATLGLGIALGATVATTLSLMGGYGTGAGAPAVVSHLTAWLVSLPWLFLAVALFAVSRIERLAQPASGREWSLLAVVSALVAALQVGGANALHLIGPGLRAAVVASLAGSVLFACRGLLGGASRALRVQLVTAVATGLVVTTGPFRMLGELLLAPPDRTAALAALLAGIDALLGLVVATLAVHAALVYVRDCLPDFSIALDTTEAPDGVRYRTPDTRNG